MKAFDLALGNIFGSNAFNMVLLVPLDSRAPRAAAGIGLADPHPHGARGDPGDCDRRAWSALQVEKRIRLLEPDAVLVITIVLGSLALIYYRAECAMRCEPGKRGVVSSLRTPFRATP